MQHVHPVIPLNDGLVRKSFRLLERGIEREVVSNRVLPSVLVLHPAVEQVPGDGGGGGGDGDEIPLTRAGVDDSHVGLNSSTDGKNTNIEKKTLPT